MAPKNPTLTSGTTSGNDRRAYCSPTLKMLFENIEIEHDTLYTVLRHMSFMRYTLLAQALSLCGKWLCGYDRHEMIHTGNTDDTGHCSLCV